MVNETREKVKQRNEKKNQEKRRRQLLLMGWSRRARNRPTERERNILVKTCTETAREVEI